MIEYRVTIILQIICQVIIVNIGRLIIYNRCLALIFVICINCLGLIAHISDVDTRRRNVDLIRLVGLVILVILYVLTGFLAVLGDAVVASAAHVVLRALLVELAGSPDEGPAGKRARFVALSHSHTAVQVTLALHQIVACSSLWAFQHSQTRYFQLHLNIINLIMQTYISHLWKIRMLIIKL